MQNKQILTISENRTATHNISKSVLAGIAPDEAAVSLGFLDVAIVTLAKGQSATLDISDMPGGFGGADWAVLVVVPAVVALLTNVLTKGGVESVTALKSVLNLSTPADIVAQVSAADVSVIIKRTGAKWNRRKIRKFIQLCSIALSQCLEDETWVYTTTGQGIPAQVYQHLCVTLQHCGPFNNDDELRAVFRDARIAPWYDSVPQAPSQNGRIRSVIDLLYEQYTSTHENALVMLLEVLCDQMATANACHQELADMARLLESVVDNDG